MPNTTWVQQGLCHPVSKEYDPWFSDDEDDKLVARSVCMSCPVRVRCLVYALVNGFSDGIYAGLDVTELNPLRDNMFKNLPADVIAALEHSYLVNIPTHGDAEVRRTDWTAKYARRAARAEFCLEELSKCHRGDVLHYEVYQDVLRAVLRNPTGTGAELGKSIGRSAPLFNQRLRECFEFFNVDLSVL